MREKRWGRRDEGRRDEGEELREKRYWKRVDREEMLEKS